MGTSTIAVLLLIIVPALAGQSKAFLHSKSKVSLEQQRVAEQRFSTRISQLAAALRSQHGPSSASATDAADARDILRQEANRLHDHVLHDYADWVPDFVLIAPSANDDGKPDGFDTRRSDAAPSSLHEAMTGMSKDMNELGHMLGRELTEDILGKIFNTLVKKSVDNHAKSEGDASSGTADDLEAWPFWGPWRPRPYGPRPYYPRPYGPRPWGPRPWGPRPWRPWRSEDAPEESHGHDHGHVESLDSESHERLENGGAPGDEADLEAWPWRPRPYWPRPYYPRPYGPRPWGPRPWRPRPWWAWDSEPEHGKDKSSGSKTIHSGTKLSSMHDDTSTKAKDEADELGCNLGKHLAQNILQSVFEAPHGLLQTKPFKDICKTGPSIQEMSRPADHDDETLSHSARQLDQALGGDLASILFGSLFKQDSKPSAASTGKKHPVSDHAEAMAAAKPSKGSEDVSAKAAHHQSPGHEEPKDALESIRQSVSDSILGIKGGKKLRGGVTGAGETVSSQMHVENGKRVTEQKICQNGHCKTVVTTEDLK